MTKPTRADLLSPIAFLQQLWRVRLKNGVLEAALQPLRSLFALGFVLFVALSLGSVIRVGLLRLKDAAGIPLVLSSLLLILLVLAKPLWQARAELTRLFHRGWASILAFDHVQRGALWGWFVGAQPREGLQLLQLLPEKQKSRKLPRFLERSWKLILLILISAACFLIASCWPLFVGEILWVANSRRSQRLETEQMSRISRVLPLTWKRFFWSAVRAEMVAAAPLVLILLGMILLVAWQELFLFAGALILFPVISLTELLIRCSLPDRRRMQSILKSLLYLVIFGSAGLVLAAAPLVVIFIIVMLYRVARLRFERGPW